MNIELDPSEARVIGCLLEKEVTTPDQYPLSLNALRNAVNQKSNREPVMDLDEVQVQQVVDGLLRKHLVSDRAGYGSGRVTKYKHRFCNTEFGAFKLDEQELAVVCALLLRGPQTPGELRTRTNRLCEFREVGEVEALLDAMAQREDGALVVKLAREPGKRESRYAHLFSGEVEATLAGLEPEPVDTVAGDDRLSALEREVAALRQEIDALRAALPGQD